LNHGGDNSVADCDIRSFARFAQRKNASGAPAEIDESLIAAH
jgi:hypothetical protein